MPSRDSVNGRRRALLGAAVSTAVLVPLSGLVPPRAAQAAAMTRLSETDAPAQALSYVQDATRATHKSYEPGQLCSNCNLIQGDTGEWRPCQIFRGKLVNENGWCAAWVRA